MWATLGTIRPDGEWQYFADPLTSRLIRLSYLGDQVWLEKYWPKAYLRLKIGFDASAAEWHTFWPKSGESEIFEVSPIPIEPNRLDIRKSRRFESMQANYSITVEEYRAAPYLINY